MRGLLPLLLSLAGAAGAAAPIPPPVDAGQPLTVFAAASLQGPLDTVAAQWTRHSGRRVVISYAGSPALAQQIAQGAPADVFISADRDWMDWLAEQGRVDDASRFDVVGNALVLVAPAAAPPRAAASAADLLPAGLGDRGRLALADVDSVPAGRYAKQALAAIGRWDAVSDRLASADNVRAALMFVARGEAPLGIVYATDAQAEPKVRVVARLDAATHAPIAYPAAAVAAGAVARGDAVAPADARRRAAGRDAAAFLAWLRSDDAWTVFAAAGFRRPVPAASTH